MICQCSVRSASHELLEQQKAAAPTTGPNSVPMPPSTTITISSPERSHAI